MLGKLSSIKNDLQEQRQKIKKELEQVAKKSGWGRNNYKARFPEYGRAEDENADEVAAFVDTLSLGENLKESLEGVELALKKISCGQYGICETCGKKIGRRRLKILSTARHCLSCKKSKRQD